MSEEHKGLVTLGLFIIAIGFVVYTQAPRHWQTLSGFLIITFGWVPLALLAITFLKEPLLLVPAAFVLGCLLIPRRRAS